MFWRLRRYRRRRYTTTDTRLFAAKLLRAARWTLYLALVFVLADLFYLSLTWPDWSRLNRGTIPKSKFISSYQQERRADRTLPPLRWQPVPLTRIPRSIRQAVILAEDSRFFQHEGFDLIAFKEAMDYNLSRGRMVLGASTISQQTVKNLFLSNARNPLRKWHELILTWGMERHLSKHRILEIYLNIAEFGHGIYGVEAAAQAYWNTPAIALDWMQAAELAAALPSPKNDNPATRSPRFTRRAQKIMTFIEQFELPAGTLN